MARARRRCWRAPITVPTLVLAPPLEPGGIGGVGDGVGEGVGVGVGAADWAAVGSVGAKRTAGPAARASPRGRSSRDMGRTSPSRCSRDSPARTPEPPPPPPTGPTAPPKEAPPEPIRAEHSDAVESELEQRALLRNVARQAFSSWLPGHVRWHMSVARRLLGWPAARYSPGWGEADINEDQGAKTHQNPPKLTKTHQSPPKPTKARQSPIKPDKTR